MIVTPLAAPLLVLLGAVAGDAHRRWLQRRNPDWFVGLWAATVGLCWVQLLVVGLVGSGPWMVLPTLETGSLVLAGAYALAYPFWFWLGGQAVFLLLGRRPAEGGALWLYRIDDRTEDFESPWDS